MAFIINTFHRLDVRTNFNRLEAAVAGTEGEVDLAMVDIDELGELAMEHGVTAVPSVIGFKNGKKFDSFIGLVDDDKLSSFVEKMKD